MKKNFFTEKPVPRIRHAFTLIELLIVVAIIAILASIALPNFMEAQVRAKVSRAASDMRSLATAIEAYMVDNNNYPLARNIIIPRDGNQNYNRVPLSARMAGNASVAGLTTPVAYITSLPRDPFLPPSGWNGMAKDTSNPNTLTMPGIDTYDYFDAAADDDEDMWNYGIGAEKDWTDSTRGCKWRLASFGPDTWGSFGIVWGQTAVVEYPTWRQGVDYDATNGTVSNGDIVRTGPKVRDWSQDGALKKQ